MSDKPGIWFVIRSSADAAKRVRRLDAPSVLAWFQGAIEEARVAQHPAETGAAALGGKVPALAKLFEAAHRHSLHTPKTPAALRKLLVEHAGVGGDDRVLVDARSVRVLVAPGDPPEAWYFFGDDAVERAPDHLAGLLEEAESAAGGEGGEGKAWDPLTPVRAPKTPKAPGSQKEPKAPASAKAPASEAAKSSKPKSSAAATAAANRHEAAWKEAVSGRGAASARAYAPAERYAEGELVHHPKFGVGVVIRVEPGKIEAIFSGASRILVHGAR